jgi:hypothetical protein
MDPAAEAAIRAANDVLTADKHGVAKNAVGEAPAKNGLL